MSILDRLNELPIEPDTSDKRKHCPWCDIEINHDEVIYQVEEEFVCEECFKQWYKDLSPSEFADKFGIYSTLQENLED